MMDIRVLSIFFSYSEMCFHKHLWTCFYTDLLSFLVGIYLYTPFNHFKKCQTIFPKWLHHFTFTKAVYKGCQFLHILTNTCYHNFFLNWRIVDLQYFVSFGCIAKYHNLLISAILVGQMSLNLFVCQYTSSIKISTQILCPFLNWVVIFTTEL